jgi:peptidoglycan biosynthesis protein MviN/MurJ (putative lipid II flippase)
MSRAYVETGGDAARQHLSNGLQQVLLSALLATVGSVCFAGPIVEIAYGYGVMSAPALNMVASLFVIGALVLPAAAFNLLVMAYLNATGRPVLVFRATLASLAALLIFIVPGVLQNSLDLLVWASVWSQIFLSVVLVLVVGRADHLGWRNWLAIVASREWAGRLMLGVMIMALAVALDASLGITEPVIRLTILAVAFALAFLVSSRHREPA